MIKSSLNITIGATVCFVNITSFGGGAAVFGYNAMMHIGTKARMVFMNNTTDNVGGGAVNMLGEMIAVGVESCVIFAYNHARVLGGGAIMLFSATLIVDSEANLIFGHNSGMFGGALVLENSIVHVNTSGIEFYSNRATTFGGAMCFLYGTMIINSNVSVKFVMNSAQVKGGAIQIEAVASNNEGHSTGILYNRFGPLLYCKSGNKIVNIGDDPSKQCASNRTGILCAWCLHGQL